MSVAWTEKKGFFGEKREKLSLDDGGDDKD